MPKERRSRIVTHPPSVKFPGRTFAVQANAVEHIDIGAAADIPIETIFGSAMLPSSRLTKKEKQAVKKETFLQKMDHGQSPYSKSHVRRLKRRAKEQIAHGFTDMQDALADMDGSKFSAPSDVSPKWDNADTSMNQFTSKSSDAKSLRIGEGKSMTLSKAQRKRALELERFRHPLILSNPEFSLRPFSTIRTHVGNTLLKH